MSGEYISREAAINRLNENWRRTNTGSIAEACYSAAIDSIHLIPAAAVVERPRWIPVTERLPEHWTSVIVHRKDGGIFICEYFDTSPTDECWIDDSMNVYSFYDVTHWMPLPEPPKEEQR